MKCELCKKESQSYRGLVKHIQAAHNITAKMYYDTYIKSKNDGICSTCGKPTPFLTLAKGYQKHCCAKCGQLDPNGKNNFRDNNPQKDSKIKARTLKTCEDLYGGRGYGSTDIQERAIQTRTLRYGPSNAFIDKAIKSYAKDNNLVYIEQAYKLNNNCGWVNDVEIILYYGQRLVNKSDLDYIKNYKGNKLGIMPIVSNIQSVYNGKTEIYTNAVYLPDLKVMISYHNSYEIALESNKPKSFILDNALKCREQNIRLINIFDFEDFDQQMYLLKEFLSGNDLYKHNFNKNNFLPIPEPEMIYVTGTLTIYGAGGLN